MSREIPRSPFAGGIKDDRGKAFLIFHKRARRDSSAFTCNYKHFYLMTFT